MRFRRELFREVIKQGISATEAKSSPLTVDMG